MSDLVARLEREAARAIPDEVGSECCYAPKWTCCDPALLSEAAARIERLEAAQKEVYDWMREPDYVENASLEWLTEWVDRRPIRAALARKEGT